MSDEELIEQLAGLRSHHVEICGVSWDDALAEAIRRLTPKPADRDCVQVRIAVATSTNGWHYAEAIDPVTSEKTAIEIVASTAAPVADSPVIITASIPRRAAPVVEGKVEQCGRSARYRHRRQ